MRNGAREVRLSEAAVDQLLDIFEAEGAAEIFNDLYTAAQQAYGTNFIPRTSCLRLVVNNDPQAVLRAQLVASLEIEEAIAAQAMENRP